MKIKGEISWSCPNPDANLWRWRVYGFKGSSYLQLEHKGLKLAEVAANARSATVEVDEGTWTFRVLAVSSDRIETDWKRAKEHKETIQKKKKTTNTLPSGSPTTSSPGPSTGLPNNSPTPSDDAPSEVVATAGPTPTQGEIVDKAPLPKPSNEDLVPRGGVLNIPTHGLPAGDRPDLHLTPLGPYGQPGPVTVDLAPIVPDMQSMELIEIASLEGSTESGWQGPASTDGFEVDATDGFRLLEIPAMEDLDSDWGNMESGILSKCPMLAKYVPEWTIQTDETNLGARMMGVLQVIGFWQRKTETIVWPPMCHSPMRMSPYDIDDLEFSKPGLEWWLSTQVQMDGTPLIGIPPTKWEYRVGTSQANLQAAAWEQFDPRSPPWIDATWIQVRQTPQDPLGARVQLIQPFNKVWLRVRQQAIILDHDVLGSPPVLTGGNAQTEITLPSDRVTEVSGVPSQMVAIPVARDGRRVEVVSKSRSTPSVTISHQVPNEDYWQLLEEQTVGVTSVNQIDFDNLPSGDDYDRWRIVLEAISDIAQTSQKYVEMRINKSASLPIRLTVDDAGWSNGDYLLRGTFDFWTPRVLNRARPVVAVFEHVLDAADGLTARISSPEHFLDSSTEITSLRFTTDQPSNNVFADGTRITIYGVPLNRIPQSDTDLDLLIMGS